MKDRFAARWLITSLIVAILLAACTPGVHGTWLVRGDDRGDIERRVTMTLESQGFTEWKPSQGSKVVLQGRLFGHREYPVGVALVAKDEGMEVRFEEDAVDRISTGGAKIYLSLDAKLKAEFGPVRVITVDVPKGLGQNL